MVEPDCLIVIANRLVEVTTEGIDGSPIVVEQAAADTAQANLVLAQADVRGLIGGSVGFFDIQVTIRRSSFVCI